MSNLVTTAFLAAAVITASISYPAFAQESAAKMKPCVGELCPPKSPTEDMPKQKLDGAKQVEQTQGQDQSSGQVKPRKKKQASLHRDQHQQSAAQVMPRKKKQASFDRNRQQQPAKKAASRSNFWDWLF